MTKHSKNNTASSVFSYAEKQKTQYGTRRQRLGRESMREFNACSLCLQRAREPLACSEGHLFCKECVYTDLLTQKKDIKKQKAKLEALKQEAEEERARARAEARDRVLREFERGQGLAAGLAGLRKEQDKTEKDSDGAAPNKKRKIEFSPTHVDKLTQEAEEAALKVIKQEQAEALKHKLPDFWLPSLTPTYTSSGPPKDLKDIKVQTVCRGGTAHEISLKSLTPVTFSFASGPSTKISAESKQDGDAICPSCKKALSNSTLMFLLTSCSHVVCKTCTDTLVRPSSQCVVCDKEAPSRKIVELQREGTGYAGGGLAETSKTGVAFQG